MAYGKIIYTPPPAWAINLTGSNWLSIAQSVFNLGVEPFNFDLLFYLDPAAQPDGESWLAGQGAPNVPPTWEGWLATHLGWILSFCKRYHCLKFVLNDGSSAYPLLYMTPEDSVAAAGWYWVGVTMPRPGDLLFYLAGLGADALVGAGEYGAGDVPAGGTALPTAYPGTLNNSEPLRLGGYDGAAWRFVGKLNFFRFDPGRSLPPDWWSQEWARVQYGFPRTNDLFQSDNLACWTFNQSLMDDLAQFVLTHNGGTPGYVAGWPYGPLEVIFAHNYKYGHSPDYLELSDRSRSLDATLNIYPGAIKQSIELPFERIFLAQLTVFEAAYLSGANVRLFLDAEHRSQALVNIVESPKKTSQPYLNQGQYLWSGTLKMESV